MPHGIREVVLTGDCFLIGQLEKITKREVNSAKHTPSQVVQLLSNHGSMCHAHSEASGHSFLERDRARKGQS